MQATSGGCDEDYSAEYGSAEGKRCHAWDGRAHLQIVGRCRSSNESETVLRPWASIQIGCPQANITRSDSRSRTQEASLTWTSIHGFTMDGLVEHPMQFSWDEVPSIPTTTAIRSKSSDTGVISTCYKIGRSCAAPLQMVSKLERTLVCSLDAKIRRS